MSNIKFNYLYRDAGNYKSYGEVIFSNSENKSLSELKAELRLRLIDGEFFDPDEFKIQQLSHKGFVFDSKLDHSWNEFVSLELTTQSSNYPRSFRQFLNGLPNRGETLSELKK